MSRNILDDLLHELAALLVEDRGIELSLDIIGGQTTGKEQAEQVNKEEWESPIKR